MTKRLVTDGNGNVVEVLAEDGPELWVKDVTNGGRFTTMACYWEPYAPTPKVGDVWTSAGENDYRVIGVDEEHGQYLLCLKREWYGGEWPVVEKGKVQLPDSPFLRSVFVRELPEETLTYKGGADS